MLSCVVERKRATARSLSGRMMMALLCVFLLHSRSASLSLLKYSQTFTVVSVLLDMVFSRTVYPFDIPFEI